MSYILDALNKSEKQRARKRAPGLSELRDESSSTKFGTKQFIGIFLLIIIVNSMGVYWYFGDRLNTTRPETDLASDLSETTVSASLSPQPLLAKPLAVKPSAVESGLMDSPQPAANSITLTPVRGENRKPSFSTTRQALARDQLPASIQVRLPELEVTSHIYASDPTFRMVKIDGVNRQEGDQLSQQHSIVEITETGLILDFEAYRYALDFIEDWQFEP
jgi:general secretion pathway protein B